MLTLRSLVPAAFALGSLAGCLNQPDVDTGYLEDHTAAARPVMEGAAVRVEQAERALDVGRDLAGARATLAAIAADPSVPADVRERATFALSRAEELQKDTEGAIRTIESMMAAHEGDRSWPAQEAAEKRLRKLLTGKEEGPSSSPRPEDKVAPIAKVLAGYFPSKKDQPTDISILAFGSEGSVSEALGTFRIDDALRAVAEEACPLCDTKLNIHSFVSRTGSWASIPGSKGRIGTSLAVFYTHLGDPIPARYDDVLPVPMSEVLAHLHKGEGLVIAKERPNAPPAILLAAPREAQLPEVEEAFSRMKALPASLTVIKVAPQLKPDEIRTAMRTQGMPAFKKCYESLLQRAPAAAGRTELAFTIKPDGTVDELRIETTDTLKEGTFERCMNAAMTPVAFAATGQSTTVKYPVTFSP